MRIFKGFEFDFHYTKKYNFLWQKQNSKRGRRIEIEKYFPSEKKPYKCKEFFLGEYLLDKSIRIFLKQDM